MPPLRDSLRHAVPGDGPSAITGRVTAKRTLTRRPDPCRGIVGHRVVPLSRNASNARLSRRDPCDALSRLAPRITGPRGLTLERRMEGSWNDKRSYPRRTFI